MIWPDSNWKADREIFFPPPPPPLFLEPRGKKRVTGGKCAENEKSLKSQVEESVLNCGARMTSGENCGKGDENVKMSLSGGLIWKVFSVYWRLRIRAVVSFLPLSVSIIDLKGAFLPPWIWQMCYLYTAAGGSWSCFLCCYLSALSDQSAVMCFAGAELDMPSYSSLGTAYQQQVRWVRLHMKGACLCWWYDVSRIMEGKPTCCEVQFLWSNAALCYYNSSIGKFVEKSWWHFWFIWGQKCQESKAILVALLGCVRVCVYVGG